MTSRIDPDRYFRRIGFTGTARPDRATLATLHRLHAEAIAFESLDPLLKRPVKIDLASLQAKLIDEGRGGYCYEHNHVFASVLSQIGFEVTGHAARVRWNLPPDAALPRTHMVLGVVAEGEPMLADVGFGGMTLTAPLHLEAGLEQTTPHENFRLVREGALFVLEARLPSGWKPIYAFDLQAQTPADYEMANWFVSTHPTSRFTQHLIAARTVPGKRYALLDRLLQVHHLHGPTEKRELGDADEVIAVLRGDFRIALDDGLAGALRAKLNGA